MLHLPGGAEGDDEIAAAVAIVAARAGQAGGDAHAQPPQLARGKRGVRGQHDHDRAATGRGHRARWLRGRHRRGHPLAHWHATDYQVRGTAEVGLHQRAHGVAADLRRYHTAGRADAALPAIAGGACAGADCPFGHGPRQRRLDGSPDLLGPDVASLEVAEITVVRLTDEDIDRTGADADVGVVADGVLHQGVGNQADVQGVGQGNG